MDLFNSFNRDFLCKISTPENSRGTLVGVSGYLRSVGDYDLALRLLKRAYRCGYDVCRCRVRSRLCVTFYSR